MASLYIMDEIVRLSKLGKKDEKQYMQLIIKYIKTNGKALSNLRKNNNIYPLNKSSLGRWIAHQKEYYRDEKLSKTKIIKLEKFENWNW